MNIIKVKKNIAREWLIFLVAIFIGVIFSVFMYFTNTPDINDNLKSLQKDIIISNNPSDQFDKRISATQLHNFRQKYPQYNDLNDSVLTNKLVIKYTSKSFDSTTAKPFIESKQESSPTFISGLSKLIKHLFSSLYWLNTLFPLLIPYLIFQLLRSIYYSTKLLLKNNNVS